MSVANGSHCQETIRMTASKGASLNQSIGVAPNSVAIQANSPETGCISRFFQTSALTVGITKNGAITISRTTLRPRTGWGKSSAGGVPTTVVMAKTEPAS